MAEYKYAKGRIAESIQFISQEMVEFDNEYASKGWEEYNRDRKFQKLVERTVENILTALIEASGTILTREGIAADNYGEVLEKTGRKFQLTDTECKTLAKLAAQRNRLAHHYLDLKWQVIRTYKEQRPLIKKLLKSILESRVAQK